MSADGADPRSFKSWEEAFQQPIPTTRQYEKRLRGHAEEYRQKLRTIVGASYRDLLDTADRIIEMDSSMKVFETTLGTIGQKCNSRAADRTVANYAKFTAQLEAKEQPRLSKASHLALLQRCASVIAKLIKRESSSLVAAKVLVLSRLTHKVLSQSDAGSDSSLLDSLRSRLASLRQRLRRNIDIRLSNPDADWKSLVDHMCAYSLTTSATPTDILRHFSGVRLKSIESLLQSKDQSSANATKAVKLLVQTLQASQSIFPKRLSEALAKLKDTPLLQQADIRILTELELDLHGRWLAQELRDYTPWPRHDELQKSEADKQRKSWAKQAVKAFIKGLNENISRMQTFQDVIDIRKEVFTSWPWSSSVLPGLDASEVVDQLRDILNERLFEIIKTQSSKLGEVTDTFGQALASRELLNDKQSNLWDADLIGTDASNGAVQFKRSVQNIYHGNDGKVRNIIQDYDTWLQKITSLMVDIKSLKDDRWDDEIDDDDDDVDTESRKALLSEDDPRELEDVLAEALSESLRTAREAIENTVQTTVLDADNSTLHQVVVALRVIRELLQRALGEGHSRKLRLTLEVSGSTVAGLQTQLASLTINAPMQSYAKYLRRYKKASQLSGLLLWEGSPPLPAQPSTSAYRFLRDLHDAMASVSGDIWSAGAAKAIKAAARGKISDAVSEALRGLTSAEDETKSTKKKKSPSKTSTEVDADDATENDDGSLERTNGATNDAKSKLNEQKALQLLFDFYYLRCATRFGSDTASAESHIIAGVREITDVSKGEQERLQKSATDYWKRTCLMFALLVE